MRHLLQADADDGFAWIGDEELPDGEFLAFVPVPCPLGAIARGGAGGQMITSCSFCGHQSPSTAMQRHDGRVPVPVLAQVSEVAGRRAVVFRRLWESEFHALAGEGEA